MIELNNEELKPMLNIKVVADERHMPQYANETDACMDLKARIVNNEPRSLEFPNWKTGLVNILHESFNSAYIMPGQMEIIPTGVQVAIPEGHVMMMFVRSSTGIKKGLSLANGTGIIDAGYRDEIMMALINHTTEPIEIKDGDRLCQFIVLPYTKLNLTSVADDADFRNGDRGGGIGSTGEK